MEKKTISRQELYKMVWKESLTAISDRLNIPFAHLRKVCIEINVPVPPSGHWSRLKLGKPVEIINLPEDHTGVNEIKIYPDSNDIGNPEILTLYKKSAVDFIKEDRTLSLKVPDKLTNPDELVKTAQKQLMEYKYDRYNDHGMVRSEGGAFNIRVSRSNIGRVLRFMDTLIKLLRVRGHNLSVKYGRYLEIDGEDYQIKLMEKSKKGSPDTKWGLPTYENTGILYFTIDGSMGRTWTDSTILIEERLAEILAKIESMIYFWKEIRRKNEESRRKREEQERIIREQQQRIEKERSNFKDIYQQAKRWQRARFMREYIKAVEDNVLEKGSLTVEIQNWLIWARAKADWYDPLVKSDDAILSQSDKDKLV